MTPREWEAVLRVRKAMSHLYKYDRLTAPGKMDPVTERPRFAKRVESYSNIVKNIRKQLAADGPSNSAALHQVDLDFQIAQRISALYAPEKKRSREPEAPVGGDIGKRARDVADPTSPKRARTETTTEERVLETGEPQQKKGRPRRGVSGKSAAELFREARASGLN